MAKKSSNPVGRPKKNMVLKHLWKQKKVLS